MTITDATFLEATSTDIEEITRAELQPNAIPAARLSALASQIDISAISHAFLSKEIKLRKAHFFLDGHNWSSFEVATNDNFIQLCERLLVRKMEMAA